MMYVLWLPVWHLRPWITDETPNNLPAFGCLLVGNALGFASILSALIVVLDMSLSGMWSVWLLITPAVCFGLSVCAYPFYRTANEDDDAECAPQDPQDRTSWWKLTLNFLLWGPVAWCESDDRTDRLHELQHTCGMSGTILFAMVPLSILVHLWFPVRVRWYVPLIILGLYGIEGLLFRLSLRFMSRPSRTTT